MHKLIKFFVMLFFGILLIGCEPISVSVNSKGEVAFTRSEGVFFIDLKSSKLTELDWNFGNPTIPIIVRWSPKEDGLAYTVKDHKDSQNTIIYSIGRNGENKKSVYSGAGKIITQLEWSTKGSYISAAQAGEDSDMNVADLVLISVKDGMSKVIAKNTGDIHKWIDDNNVVFIKINKKNTKNTDIFKGELSLYNVSTQKITVLTPVILGRTGALDATSSQVVFTAIKTDKEANDFTENMTADGFVYLYNVKDKNITKLSDVVINFVKFSPDESKILVKSKEEGYTGNFNLSCIDLKTKALKILINNVADTVSASSSSIQVYPTWLDNNNVLYFRINNSYGSNGQAIQLMSVDINSLKKSNYQLAIDTEITKLIDKHGGY